MAIQTQRHRRHARMGLPQINQNPRPPNERKPMSRRVAQAKAGYGQQSGGSYGGQQQGGGYVKPPNSTYGQPSTQPQFDPNDPLSIPNYTPGKGQVDPRDATYYQNVYRLQRAATQGIAQNQLEQSYSNTDYSENQQNLALRQQTDQRGLAENALRSGLINSGYLDRSDAENTRNYVIQGGDLATSKYREDAARAAARQAILQGFPQDVAAQYAEAAARAADAAVKASTGAPSITPKDVKKAGINRHRHRRHRG